MAILIPAIITVLEVFWVAIYIPEYIGEGETTTMIFPFRYVFILWLLLFSLFIYAHIRDASLFELQWPKNSKIAKIIGSILAIPTFSIFFSFVIVYSIFSLINYSGANEEVVIEGKLYKKEITEKRRRRSIKKTKKYYAYFNEDKKYRLEVSQSMFNNLKEEDIIELNVLKGKLNGYYVNSDSINYKRLIEASQTDTL